MSVPGPTSARKRETLQEKLMDRAPLFSRESAHETHLAQAVDDIPQHTLADTSATKQGDQSNIMRAMQLVRTGCVEVQPGGKSWRVTGATGVYIVRPTSCSCPQGRHKDWCYHRMAAQLYGAFCARLVSANLPLPEWLEAEPALPLPATVAEPASVSEHMVGILDRLVTRGVERLPECAEQFQAARAIVEAGGVMLLDDEHATVWVTRGRADDPVTVAEHCPLEECADAPRKWCEHRLASALMRRLVEEMEKDRVDTREEPDDIPEPAVPAGTVEPPTVARAEQVAPIPPVPVHAEPVEPLTPLQAQPEPDITPTTPMPEQPEPAAFPESPTPERAEPEQPVASPVGDHAESAQSSALPVGDYEERPSEPATKGLGLKPLAPRSIAAIMADLSKPLPKECVASLPRKGAQIPYLHHFVVLDVLDMYAPGWNGMVVKTELLGSRCVVTYRLTIPCAEGIVVREDIGQENELEEGESGGYGDPSSNAKAMAFKRAAMQFGVGRWLYSHDTTRAAVLQHLQNEKLALWKVLAEKVDAAGLVREDVLQWLKHQTSSATTKEIPASAIQALIGQLTQEDGDGV